MAKKKVAEIKAEMGFTNDNPVCMNCVSFGMDTVEKKTTYGTFTQDKNLRCLIGGFAVKKTTWCRHHSFKK